MSNNKKIVVLKNAISDMVSNLLYYDRKEDEELSLKDIEYLLETKKHSLWGN